MLEFFQNPQVLDAIKLMFVSALPIVELRGGIPMGVIMGMPALENLALCVIGNMLPVPFIVVLWRWAVSLIKKWLKSGKIVDILDKIQAKADSKLDKLQKYEMWGIFLFVAIPLPGTGAWTGALIAATLQMKLSRAFWPILAGVITAGIIMTILSYGAGAVFGSIF